MWEETSEENWGVCREEGQGLWRDRVREGNRLREGWGKVVAAMVPAPAPESPGHASFHSSVSFQQ